ncbi:MAG: hypothetical protein FWH10_03840 [Oscillospiraceae bacterium]|nr:hypothetical protein [Oscillospiraceae bacterium]
MRRKIKNLLFLFLTALLTLAVFCSCASEDSGSPGGGAGGGGGDIPGQNGEADAETGEPDIEADGGRLPFEPADLDLRGGTFTIAAAGWGTETTSDQRDVVHREEDTGDIINDAVYARNMAVEDLFNCTIVQEKFPWPGDLGSAVRRAVNADDDAYDAAYIRFGDNLSPLATGGLLLDLKQTPNMDITQPWWDRKSVDQLSISGKLFAVTGDIQILDKGSLSAFVFNKRLQADYQIESLYSLVKTGGWTLRKMLEITKQVSDDLDGNGIMDENDLYGLLYYRDAMPAFLAGAGEYITRKDENDIPYMSFNTEKVYSALDLIYEVIYDENVSFHSQKVFGETDAAGFIVKGTNMFQNDQVLLMYVRMTEIEPLRGMETDFGILPFPKYDESQSDYLSIVNSYIGSALAVPATADPEVSGAILEAMAYESRYTLIPAYYNVTLKTKVGRDEESEEMLDIIFGNMVYDLGGLFRFGGIETELMNSTTSFKREMASFYERNESRAVRDIERLVENIQNLD